MSYAAKTILTLPNDIKYLPLAMAYVHQAAVIGGFSETDALKLELAVEEGITGIVAPSFIPGEKVEFQIIAAKTPLGMRFILKDRGMPYEPERFPVYSQPDLQRSEMDETAAMALSLHMMEQAADKLEFFNLGKEGKETHIIKYLPVASVEQSFTEEAKEERLEEQPGQPLPNYHIRYLQAEEALAVSKLAYVTYGYTYKSFIYYPEQIRELNVLGNLVSLVAVSEKSEVLGHGALMLEDGDKQVAELGIGFVKPCYRGQGLLNQLMIAMMEEAEKRALTGFFGQPVTSHPYSQKACIRWGMQPTALFLARFSAVKFKDIKPDNQQRESFFHYFRYLRKDFIDTPLYLPPQHKEILASIYRSLELERTFLAPEPELSIEGKGIITAQRYVHYHTATIQIKQYGRNVLQEVKHLLKGLLQEDMKAIVLELSLADPCTAIYVTEFERLGFLFAGVLPHGSGEDILCLQYVNGCHIDFAQIKVHGDTGQAIAAYVHQQYEKE